MNQEELKKELENQIASKERIAIRAERMRLLLIDITKENNKLRESAKKLTKALKGLIQAEEATIDQFEAEQIDALEKALDIANETIECFAVNEDNANG